jgi:plastocyanin
MQPVRSLSALALAALVIVGLAACSSGQAPGWTYAPPPSPSAAPSSAPSAGASTAASAAPSAAAPSGAASASTAPPPEPSAAPSAGASGGTGGTTVIPEVAQNIQFTNLALAAPAGQPFQIAFDNQDASIPHNIEIIDGSGATLFDGDIVTGVAQTTYSINALPAGTYKFICKIHPNVMIGALTVQ